MIRGLFTGYRTRLIDLRKITGDDHNLVHPLVFKPYSNTFQVYFLAIFSARILIKKWLASNRIVLK